MANGRNDPYRVYNFKGELDGIVRAAFRECSAIDSSQDPIEYREGTDSLTARKLHGLVKYANITLKWGITADDELWQWRQQIMSGNDERKNGSIVLLDDLGEEKVRWNFINAWPSKWTAPALNATGNEVAIETLELVHEGLEKA